MDGTWREAILGLFSLDCEETFPRTRAVGAALTKMGIPLRSPSLDGSYLVDPASSHMLVSKIKPCMSKYKPH